MDAIVDGVRLFYLPMGAGGNYPLIVLHGGPGLDHTEMHPWLDPLGDTFRLLYVDLRGHGRSERVDPATLSLGRYAEDVSLLAAALGLSRYAVLGRSYGAFIALAHAVERGDASHYVISSGSASMSRSMREVEDSLARFEPVELREAVTASWAREPRVTTPEEVAEVMEQQMPFHFASVDSDAYRRYTDHEREGRAVYAPEPLAYAATHEYAIEYEDRLGAIARPTLILSGATSSNPRATSRPCATSCGGAYEAVFYFTAPMVSPRTRARCAVQPDLSELRTQPRKTAWEGPKVSRDP